MRRGLIAASLCALPLAAHAGVLVTSGRLLDGSDRPVDRSAVPMQFRLWTDAVGGSPLWESAACAVDVRQGAYATVLGSACGIDIPDAVWASSGARYLEVQVDGVTLLPRQPLAPVPAARTSLDTQQLATRLSSSGTVNDPSNPVHWSQLRGVPGDLVDGDADTPYTAGQGLTLVGREFRLDTGSIGTASIIDGAVTGVKIGSAAVTSIHLADGSVTSSKIAAGAVGTVQLADGSITAAKFAAGALDGARPANGSVGAALLANDGASLAKVTADALSLTGTGVVASTAIQGAVKTDAVAAIPIPDFVPFGFRASADSDGAGLFAWKQAPDQTDGILWYGDDSNARLRVMKGTWDGTKQTLSDVAVFEGNGDVTIQNRLRVHGVTRLGNSIYNAFSTGLPVNMSYSNDPVHLKTGWRCDSNVMWTVQFQGYNFIAGAPINIMSVGYSYAGYGLTKVGNKDYVDGSTTASQYCSSDNYVTFKLTSNVQWHASDLVVNVLAGNSYYNRTAVDTFQVLAAENRNSNY